METGSSTRPTSAPVSERGVSIDAVLEAARQAASIILSKIENLLSRAPHVEPPLWHPPERAFIPETHENA